MTLFIDEHPMDTFNEKTLNELQNSPRDEFGITHKNILYNKDEDKIFCILDAPNKEAVDKHHNKAGLKCESIMEVKSTAWSGTEIERLLNTSKPAAASVERHYTRSNLENTILTALQNSGKNLDQLSVDDLAPIDELHPLGREATSNLASLLNIQPTSHVIDVGSGIGGPSRYLASKFGCHVTGLDLVEEYCRVADSLAKRVKLDNLLTYRQGDATQMPFDDTTFDVVWTQHASMNIADKKKLYSEMYRVLKPGGGKLAVNETYKGSSDMDDSSIYFPVPWAANPSISHLISAEEVRKLLKDVVGFKEIVWEDKTESVTDWIKQMIKRSQTSGGPPPSLGIHVIVSPRWSEMVKNALKNLEEGRITVVQSIFERR